MNNAEILDSFVFGVIEKLKSRGIESAGRKVLANGVQVVFQRAGRQCGANFYYSKKKGFSVVPAGGDGVLFGKVRALAEENLQADMFTEAGNAEHRNVTPEGLGSDAESFSAATSGALPIHAETWIGTDEAGKGDYMGPLVAAGVYVNRIEAGLLRKAGVRDSKLLSTGMIRETAGRIRSLKGMTFTEVVVSPAQYNRRFRELSEKGGNSLDILAECHGKVIRRLLEKPVEPETVIVDKFSSFKRIGRYLPSGDFRIELRERGESDPAVAAASILARDRYLAQLRAISRKYGIEAISGSGRNTDSRVEEFVAAHGPKVLNSIVKMHFCNTERILRSTDQRS